MADTFQLYSRKTDYSKDLRMDHVFVTSDLGDNWNCFGNGKDRIGDGETSPVRSAVGCARWANLIYDPSSQGKEYPVPACLLIERYDGVCHTAANRILVLCGENVRGVHGNEIATLMYGNFGLNLDKYVQKVKDTFQQVRQENPTALTEADLEKVLERITGGESPEDELAIIKADIAENMGKHLDDLDDSKRSSFDSIYGKFHSKREEAFAAEPWKGTENYDQLEQLQKRYAARLAPSLLECLKSLEDLLTPDGFTHTFGVTPESAMKFLLLGGK